MRDAVTAKVKQYFVTCIDDKGNKETFQVPSRQYEYNYDALLRYVQKQPDSKLVEVERKFVDISPYWMSTEDFLKHAEKGRIGVTPNGNTRIVKLNSKTKEVKNNG